MAGGESGDATPRASDCFIRCFEVSNNGALKLKWGATKGSGNDGRILKLWADQDESVA